MNHLLRILALAACIAFTSAAYAADKTPIRFVLDWAFEAPQAIWAVDAESGCFGRSNLDVKMDRGFGSGDSISKVASGAYDVGVADFMSLVSYNASHPDSKLVAALVISERAPTSVVTLKKNGIAKPQDLVGKRIADAQGEASRVLFPAFAKANGIDPNAVTWVSVAPNLRQPILLKGEADAAAGHLFTITVGLRALGLKMEDIFVMPYADWGLPTFGNSLIVKPQWAAAHADAMRAFAKCAVLAAKQTIADPAGAIAALKKYNPLIDEKLELDALDFSNNKAVLTDDVKKNGISSFSAERLDELLAKLSDALGIAKPAGSEVWTSAYLPPRDDLKIQ